MVDFNNEVGFSVFNSFQPLAEHVYAMLATESDDPQTYEQAITSKDSNEWKQAMQEEMSALKENNTWSLEKLPKDRKAIGAKWTFKKKINKEGKVERYKARLCAKGFSQKEGIDYNETFAPVLKYKSLRLLLALAAIKDWEVKQMDVQTAFLNAEIKEEVYMQQPQGFSNGDKNIACKLIKTLYGTKQAPHEWNNVINEFILSLGFKRCKSDTCIYIKMSISNNKPIIIAIFVDDIIIVYSIKDEKEWLKYKETFMNTYKMKDLGNAEWILGIRVTRNRKEKTIKLDHEVQINKTVKQFHMEHSNPAPTPAEAKKLSSDECPQTEQQRKEMINIPYRSIVGSLQYITLSTRPDISFAVNQLSRYIENPGHSHWTAGKRVLRYLKGTTNTGLLYKDYDQNGNTKIEIFCDADWGGDTADRKSTTGLLVKLNGCVITWLSKKQPTVALSTAEAEYIAIATALQELIWLNQLLEELQLKDKEVAVLKSDNQAAIAMSNNDVNHSRSKHIDIKYHFIREVLNNKQVELNWVNTKDQQADINTKALDGIGFKRLRDIIMAHDTNTKTKGNQY
jgi:hypothetical protein